MRDSCTVTVACKNSCQLQIMCEHERSPHQAHTRLILTVGWDRGTSLGWPWKGCGLWRSALELHGWELASTVFSNPIAALPQWNKIEADPVAHDTAVQRRLSAEPRTPFFQQMYCWDLLARPTSKSDLIILIVWLFNAAAPPFFISRGKRYYHSTTLI